MVSIAQPYNDPYVVYNGPMPNTSHVMTISRNGQVSIPADARSRWNTRQVIVVDLGDRVVMRPVSDRPVEELEGKYGGRGPSSDRSRRQARRDETARSRNR